jgi:hypothetical protein
MSTQSIALDKLPMAGKYDGRGKHDNHVANSTSFSSDGISGRKPKSRKNLAGARSNRYLNKIEKLKSPDQMFNDAIQAKNYSLAWQIRSDVRAEACGKPYVAINPDERRQEPADVSRIAVAIKNLQIVNGPEPSKSLSGRRSQEVSAATTQVALESVSGGSGTELASGQPQVIEAGAKPGAPR